MSANREVGTHEVDADGGDVALGVCIVGETEQKARLSTPESPISCDETRGWRGEYFGETFDEGGICRGLGGATGPSGHAGRRIDVYSSFDGESDTACTRA